MLLSRHHVSVNYCWLLEANTKIFSLFQYFHVSSLDAMKSMVTESFELIIQVRSNLGDLEQVV